MDLSIIIVNYNVVNDIITCIRSIYHNIYNINFEIIVVDNNSTDSPVLEIGNIFKDVKVIRLTSNEGYGHANNIGMKSAKGKYFLIVNPDIIFEENVINYMYNFLDKNANVGMVGPLQIKPNEGIEYYYTFFPTLYSRTIQELGLYNYAPIIKKRIFSLIDDCITTGTPLKVEWVMGSCMMIKRQVYESTKGFDESFFLFEEETELQYRASKLGWEVYLLPEAKVIHNHHSSASKYGLIFIRYHEFRSRILFSIKHDRFPVRQIRQISIFLGLLFRMIRAGIFAEYSISNKSIQQYLYCRLIKLNFESRECASKDRFDSDKFLKYFRD